MTILSHEGIDWQQKAWSSGAGIPVLVEGSKTHGAAKAALEKLKQAEPPASADQISVLMYQLQGHYWQPNMPESLALSVAQTFTRLLSEFSPQDIQKACDEYLCNAKNVHFPKVGQMIELCKSIRARRRWQMQKLQALLQNAAPHYAAVESNADFRSDTGASATLTADEPNTTA